MEFVPYATEQLAYFTRQDTYLAPIFEGVFAADQLPHSSENSLPRAYIANADEISKPGTHWLAIFTKDYKCEVFDSYGLPLNWYITSVAIRWIYEHFDNICSNAVTLQEIESQSCGQYALMYLRGCLSYFHPVNFASKIILPETLSTERLYLGKN